MTCLYIFNNYSQWEHLKPVSSYFNEYSGLYWMCLWIIWIFRAIQDLKHYLHMGQLKAVTLCLGYHFTLQVWLVFFLLCLSTGFESLPQGLQKTSEPPGLKFLRVLGQMTPWARNDSLGWPPEVNLGPPDPLRIIIVPKNTSKNLLKSGGPCSQQCTNHY